MAVRRSWQGFWLGRRSCRLERGVTREERPKPRKAVELDMMILSKTEDYGRQNTRDGALGPWSFGISRSPSPLQTQLDGAPPQFQAGSCEKDLRLHLSLVFPWYKFARFWRDFCQKRGNTESTGDDDVVRGMGDAEHV